MQHKHNTYQQTCSLILTLLIVYIYPGVCSAHKILYHRWLISFFQQETNLSQKCICNSLVEIPIVNGQITKTSQRNAKFKWTGDSRNIRKTYNEIKPILVKVIKTKHQELLLTKQFDTKLLISLKSLRYMAIKKVLR